MNCSECPYTKNHVCEVENDAKCPIKVNLHLTKKELIVLYHKYLDCWETIGLIKKIEKLKEKTIKETGNP